MARLTQSQSFAACDALNSANVTPTMQKVREITQAGGGSTIQQHINEWKALQGAASTAPTAPVAAAAVLAAAVAQPGPIIDDLAMLQSELASVVVEMRRRDLAFTELNLQHGLAVAEIIDLRSAVNEMTTMREQPNPSMVDLEILQSAVAKVSTDIVSVAIEVGQLNGESEAADTEQQRLRADLNEVISFLEEMTEPFISPEAFLDHLKDGSYKREKIEAEEDNLRRTRWACRAIPSWLPFWFESKYPRKSALGLTKIPPMPFKEDSRPKP